MSSCIFCKIALGELPSARVLDAGRLVAFLDINPVNRGHLLLVPKDHHATLADLPADLAAEAGGLLPALCRAVQEAGGAEALNVIVNIGRVAGQTVDHVHWHVIPRFADDAVRWPWPHVSYEGDGLEQMRRQVEAALSPKT